MLDHHNPLLLLVLANKSAIFVQKRDGHVALDIIECSIDLHLTVLICYRSIHSLFKLVRLLKQAICIRTRSLVGIVLRLVKCELAWKSLLPQILSLDGVRFI